MIETKLAARMGLALAGLPPVPATGGDLDLLSVLGGVAVGESPEETRRRAVRELREIESMLAARSEAARSPESRGALAEETRGSGTPGRGNSPIEGAPREAIEMRKRDGADGSKRAA
ncbi:MAG: hypothetical protein FJY88_10135 [Candidatus Eisenbacteria bacterium]|nr:hypothetical protein [Candidatus Eisenbacteria bacterium]